MTPLGRFSNAGSVANGERRAGLPGGVAKVVISFGTNNLIAEQQIS